MGGSVHRLANPWGSRALWLILAAISIPLVIGPFWSALFSDEFSFTARLVVLGLVLLYGLLADAAARLGLSSGAVILGPDEVRVRHRALARPTVAVPLDQVRALCVDPRPRPDRRTAAAIRGTGASFVDQRWPVVSGSVRDHGHHPGGAPNAVLAFRNRIDPPKVPLHVRGLLAISGGRHGRYRGPKPSEPMGAVRLDLADPEALAREADQLGVDVGPLRQADEDYLAPITDDDRQRHRRQQLIIVGILVGIFGVAVLFTALGS